jgi:hypothetical protein
MELSQAEFAALLRRAGQEAGEPNACNKRLVQKWESGAPTAVRPNYRRALRSVTGMPFAALCSPVGSATPLERAGVVARLDRAMAEGDRMMEEIAALRQALLAGEAESASDQGG